jgi:hypothetical protein
MEKQLENNEEKKETKIDLHFFRHSIKSSDQVSADDTNVLLSDAGKKLAVEKAFTDVNHNQAMVFGTERLRTQETGALVMSGDNDDITGNETLDELKEKINKDLKMGSRIGIDNRLNFIYDENTPFGKLLSESIDRKEYLKYVVEESDRVAKELGDTTGANYSRKAADIARIIQKYIKMSPRWSDMVNDPKDKYTPTLERYMATHQGMQESFIAKILEKTDGVEARNKFVESLNNNGFDYIEGFEAQITNNPNGDISVDVSYTGKDPKISFKKRVPKALIAEIIAEDK